MLDYRVLMDQELTVLLKEGDQYAYTEIFERYNQLLIKHAFQLLQDSGEAGDLVQDVFLSLWQKRIELSFQKSLASYLYTAVRNRVFDVFAHQKVMVKYQQSMGRFNDSDYTIADEQVREKELAALIEKEIGALPKKMQQIFVLSRQQDMSYREIAEQLNISDQTVKLQVHNAIKRLKVKLSSFLSIYLLF